MAGAGIDTRYGRQAVGPLACAQDMGYDHLESPALSSSLRRCAEISADRIKSFRPVRAVVEIVQEHDVGLLVYGPERSVLPARRYRKALRAMREDLTCLLWVAG